MVSLSNIFNDISSVGRTLNSLTSNGGPAQAIIRSGKAAATSSSQTFPADLGSIFMSFQFYDYRNIQQSTYRAQNSANNNVVEAARAVGNANKQNVADAVKASKIQFGQISLPIPSSLADNFHVDYKNVSLGIQGAIGSKILQKALGNSGKDPVDHSSLGDTISSVFTSSANTNIANALGSLDSSTKTEAIVRAGIMGLGTEASAIFDISTGVATNPNIAILFAGPQLKQHTFSWRLSPRTPAESETLLKLIGIFKRAMHPSQLNSSTSAFLKFPSECLAQFHGPSNQFLYPLRPCVVEDFSVNYATNGAPAFHLDGNVTTVEITVRLQETSYYTRESFDDSTEFGSDGLGSVSSGLASINLSQDKGTQ
jgi:hypothetical protein